MTKFVKNSAKICQPSLSKTSPRRHNPVTPASLYRKSNYHHVIQIAF
ncbi:hypothetical protein D1AOALGA4SA_9370 [Olavius algarvensis Delta 1 endosymbiont]|nr:hypothetical protein D1AOALGA4SA_9370 [Olavius algarvensis Delta 1 endosymbiont]